MKKSVAKKQKNSRNKDRALKEQLLEQLRRVPIVQHACEMLQINRMAFYRLKQDDQQFAQEVEMALQEGRLLVNDLAEAGLFNGVKGGKLPAVMYWLEHHHQLYKRRDFQAGFALAQDEDQNLYFEFFGQVKPENQKLIEPYLQALREKDHDKEA